MPAALQRVTMRHVTPVAPLYERQLTFSASSVFNVKMVVGSGHTSECRAAPEVRFGSDWHLCSANLTGLSVTGGLQDRLPGYELKVLRMRQVVAILHHEKSLGIGRSEIACRQIDPVGLLG